jgi:hypothetical protein
VASSTRRCDARARAQTMEYVIPSELSCLSLTTSRYNVSEQHIVECANLIVRESTLKQHVRVIDPALHQQQQPAGWKRFIPDISGPRCARNDRTQTSKRRSPHAVDAMIANQRHPRANMQRQALGSRCAATWSADCGSSLRFGSRRKLGATLDRGATRKALLRSTEVH